MHIAQTQHTLSAQVFRRVIIYLSTTASTAKQLHVTVEMATAAASAKLSVRLNGFVSIFRSFRWMKQTSLGELLHTIVALSNVCTH